MWRGITVIRQLDLAAKSSRQFQPSIATSVPSAVRQTRAFHQISPSQTASDDKIHDRNTLNPERSEVTKSGTDGEVAKHPSAYDPTNTSPEGEIEAVEKESQSEGKVSNPLDMSPANKEVSGRNPKEGTVDRKEKTNSSSRGQTPKSKVVNPGIGKK